MGGGKDKLKAAAKKLQAKQTASSAGKQGSESKEKNMELEPVAAATEPPAAVPVPETKQAAADSVPKADAPDAKDTAESSGQEVADAGPVDVSDAPVSKPEPSPSPASAAAPPKPGKLGRWLNRAATNQPKPEDAVPAAAPTPSPAPAPAPPAAASGEVKSKLGRWMQRAGAAQPEAPPGDAATTSESPSQGEEKKGKVTPRGAPPGGYSLNKELVPKDLDGWARIVFPNGEYEGEFLDGKPHGHGRTYWSSGMVYVGQMERQEMNGQGKFYCSNGDVYTGSFKNHKPCGEGILEEMASGKRYLVSYDGTKKFSENPEPTTKVETEPAQVPESFRLTVAACAKGDKKLPFKNGDYRHCLGKSIEGKFCFACPYRANEPLKNSKQMKGKIAVVQRGSCSYGKKLRYCQEAGACAMMVVGIDNNQKYSQVFQIHEGDPRDDDEWPEDAVPAPVKCQIPTWYMLGVWESKIVQGACARVRFFEGAPGTPQGWLLGWMECGKQTVHPDMTKEEADNLLQQFLANRKEERNKEAEMLVKRLENPGAPVEDPLLQGPTADISLTSAVGKLSEFLGPEAFGNPEPLGVVDDWVAGNSGAMTFTVAEPPYKLANEPVKNPKPVRYAGKRDSNEEGDKMFEMDITDAFIKLFTGVSTRRDGN